MTATESELKPCPFCGAKPCCCLIGGIDDAHYYAVGPAASPPRLRCDVCLRGIAEGVDLHRVNKPGEMPARWRCWRHFTQQPAEPPSEKAKERAITLIALAERAYKEGYNTCRGAGNNPQPDFDWKMSKVYQELKRAANRMQPTEAVSEAALEATNKIMSALGQMDVLDFETPSQSNSAWDGMLADILRAITAATAAQQAEIAALREENRGLSSDGSLGDFVRDLSKCRASLVTTKDERDTLRAELATTRERLAKCEGELSTDVFLRELKDWQLATFPGETITGVYEHLQDEVRELGDDLSDHGELADCLMLAMCLCFHQGIDPIAAMRAKHAVNLARKWQKTEAGFRHVKESLAAQPLDGGAK